MIKNKSHDIMYNIPGQGTASYVEVLDKKLPSGSFLLCNPLHGDNVNSTVSVAHYRKVVMLQ